MTYDDGVRAAEPIHAAHDTYDKGEVGSIGALIGDVTRDLSLLMRQEVALAKAELTESATKAGTGAGLLAGAGVAALYAVLFVSLGIWALLDFSALAAFIGAVVWAVITAVLAIVGRSNLKKVAGLPRTIETARAVPDALKGNETS